VKEKEDACMQVEEGSDVRRVRKWSGRGIGEIVAVKGEVKVERFGD